MMTTGGRESTEHAEGRAPQEKPTLRGGDQPYTFFSTPASLLTVQSFLSG